jgi:hypothetical protein
VRICWATRPPASRQKKQFCFASLLKTSWQLSAVVLMGHGFDNAVRDLQDRGSKDLSTLIKLVFN